MKTNLHIYNYTADQSLSEETIQKILSGNQISLDDLSPEEVKQFKRAIASGELSKLIKPWEPWWVKPSARAISLSREGAQLVQLVHNQALPPQDSSEDSQSSEIPSGPENPLPPVNKLSSTNPSPLLSVHLIDIIYSYCFTLRLYNGDWKSDAFDASTVVLSISSVLGEGAQPESVSEALSHCLEQTCSPLYKNTGGLKFGLALFDDIVTLLNLGRNALICALCDLQRLIQSSERDLRSENPRKLKKKSEIKSRLKFSDRKVYFMMCWVHEQPEEAWSSLAAIVEMEKGSIAEVYSEGRKKPTQKRESRDKVMIEEIQ